MVRLYLVVTFLASVLAVIFSVHNNENCRQLDFNLPILGKSLLGHVIRTIKVPDVPQCQLVCFLEAECVSVNLKTGENSPEMICELNNADANSHPQHLMSVQPSSYFGTKNACFSNPCLAGATCQTGFTEKGYRCLCSTGSYCAKAHWIKVNILPVCFGARDNSYGVFKIPITGQVISFKLVYRSGYLNCARASRHRSNWGCKALRPPRNLAVFITDHIKKRILPTNSALFRKMRDPCATGIFYSVPGVTSDSPELGFNNFSSPMTVTVGQEFQIWYGEDLTNCNEQDNKGHTCADIYGLYL